MQIFSWYFCEYTHFFSHIGNLYNFWRSEHLPTAQLRTQVQNEFGFFWREITIFYRRTSPMVLFPAFCNDIGFTSGWPINEKNSFVIIYLLLYICVRAPLQCMRTKTGVKIQKKSEICKFFFINRSNRVFFVTNFWYMCDNYKVNIPYFHYFWSVFAPLENRPEMCSF